MARYGPQFGPDITFLGVDRCDWADPASYPGAAVVIIGAPFDGGTSYRSGARFGPQYIRQTDYLPHDGSRPSLALRTDGLRDLRVYDAGDVEMFSGDAARSVRDLQACVHQVTAAGAVPLILGGDHTITWPDAAGVAQHRGQGRVSLIHFDAHADTGDTEFGSLIGHGQPMRRLMESGAVRGDRFLQMGLRGYWPGPETLGWMAEQRMRSYEMTEIVERGLPACLTEAFTIATDDCDGVFLSVDIDVCDPAHAPRTGPPRAGGVEGPPAGGGGPAHLLRAAGGRDRRGRGGAPLRPRRHHRLAGQPGRAGGLVRAGPAAKGCGRGHHLGPQPAAARRARAPRGRGSPGPGRVTGRYGRGGGGRGAERAGRGDHAGPGRAAGRGVRRRGHGGRRGPHRRADPARVPARPLLGGAPAGYRLAAVPVLAAGRARADLDPARPPAGSPAAGRVRGHAGPLGGPDRGLARRRRPGLPSAGPALRRPLGRAGPPRAGGG